jgi:mutator family transposase
VQLVVSDAHAGLKKAIAQVLGCPWQRCSVHFLREALGHVRKDQQGMVAALLRPIFNADTAELARELVSDALERLQKPRVGSSSHAGSAIGAGSLPSSPGRSARSSDSVAGTKRSSAPPRRSASQQPSSPAA